jgi:polyhydroxybutyrate depolymerase
VSIFACVTPPPPEPGEAAPSKRSAASVDASAPSGDAAAPSQSVPACKDKPGGRGDTNVELSSGGRTREAIIHAPPGYDPTRPIPVVLVLHPLLLDNVEMRRIVNIERFADEGPGFLAVFPNGIDHSWNAGECCGTAKDDKVDDVGFIRDLLAHVEASYCVDPAHIFSMGFSNGAFLSHRLACELGRPLAAIAPVAGTLGIPEGSCKPPSAVPVFAIHGTDDRLVPFNGGPPSIPFGSHFGTFLSPGETDAFWATQDGCPSTVVTSFTHGDVTCRSHACRAEVTLCTVQGGGHQWPGGMDLPAMGELSNDIDATEAVVAFFRRYGL